MHKAILSTVTPEVRSRLTPEVYHKIVKTMWDNIEREGFDYIIGKDDNLYITLSVDRAK